MVGDVLLGSAKVSGSRFLGFVTGDVKIFKGVFFYLSRVLLNGSQADPFFFFYLPVEWQKVTKRFPIAKLGVEGGLLGKRLLQAI